jgi:hypothetical protein
VTRLVGLVADYGPGDLRFAETTQRLALLAPEAELSPTRVADGDTLAAGLCVADLALSPGPPGRVVVHDVAADRLVVQIGDCREPARLRDARQVPGDGELVLEPGTHGLHRLTLGGGRAADRFGAPAAGTPVTVIPAGR